MKSKYKAVNRKWNKKLKEWKCEFCGKDTNTIYVVTGHDHTDSSIYICNCGGGTSIEKEWDENPWARDSCPLEYKD